MGLIIKKRRFKLKDFIEPPQPLNIQKSEERKEYPISDDIALLHDKSIACKKLRDLAIKLPFGYWKARKAATDSEYFKRIFWKKVRRIYPELDDYHLKYYSYKQVIIIKEIN